MMEEIAACSCGGTDLEQGFMERVPVYWIHCRKCGQAAVSDWAGDEASELSATARQAAIVSAVTRWNEYKQLAAEHSAIAMLSDEIGRAVRAMKLHYPGDPDVVTLDRFFGKVYELFVRRETIMTKELNDGAVLLSKLTQFYDRKCLFGEAEQAPRGGNPA